MIVVKEPEKLKTDLTCGAFSMSNVGRVLGYSKAFLSQICKGTRTPNPQLAVGICEILGKQFEDYFFISNVDKTQTKEVTNDNN